MLALWLETRIMEREMLKQKRKSGHYCKICSEYKSNESFSGKGHAKHICKRCSKKSPTEQAADITLNRLFNMPFRKLSPVEKSWLENRLHDQRKKLNRLLRRYIIICILMRSEIKGKSSFISTS
jgi:hypothetical protein